MHMKIKYNPYHSMHPWVVLFPCDDGSLIFMSREKTLEEAYNLAIRYHFYLRMGD